MITEANNRSQAVSQERKAWVAPVVQKMRAGEAEAGPNPFRPEGAFGMGS